ncbi:MAG: hypothetical protein JXA21_28470, partial [Anaerolineae bacterium]|nr:hypothetical protein [Anaerolineae bacterium]
TQVDPFAGVLELPGTQHPYAYGLDNPLRYRDPSGESVVALLVATAVYVGGYFAYNYADNHVKEGIERKTLNALGFVTGWKSIKKDMHTLSDTCSTKECKALAAVDMAFNGVMGISMFMGVGAMFKSAKAAWAKRGMASAERLAYLRGLAGPGITVNQGSRFFRPLGESVIELSTGAFDDAGRLAGGFYHELAHVGQEFGTPKILRWAPQGLQQLSAWTTKTFGALGTLLPTYVWNPVEVHAATSGLLWNWGNFALP